MAVAVIAFVAGVYLLLQRPEVPPPAVLALAALPLLLPLGCRRGLCLALAALAAGFVYGGLRAHLAGPPDALPAALEGRDILVRGRVESLPLVESRRVRFELDVRELRADGRGLDPPGRLRLSWYGAPATPRAGEVWQLQVRVKRPRGFSNPGGFDYEGWLFRQGIRGTGYVRDCDCNRRLAAGQGLLRPDRWRQHIRQRLEQLVADPQARALISALAIGDRSGFPPGLWSSLQRTGTSHLVAISGLHIGLVSGLVYLLSSALWRRLGRLPLFVPASTAGALAGMAAALVYAALAGFSVPTRRALIMVSVALGGILLRRRVRPWRLLAIALLLVVLLDPFAMLSAGFWLSFGAVGLLIYAMAHRAGRPSGPRRLGRAQWTLALGLTPLVVGWFRQASLVAPAANLLAVPWFSLVLVPLVLCSVLLAAVAPAAAAWPMALTEALAGWTLEALEWAASAELSAVKTDARGLWPLAAAALGGLLLLAPAGLPGRWLGLLLCLPLLAHRPQPLPRGAFEMTLLDVGQGLSAVVRTRAHTLVYDAGPRYSDRFNAGDAVVLPFLQASGVDRIDAMIVSHGANDHAGGVPPVLAHMPVGRVLSGEPGQLEAGPVRRCSTGQSWRWDGVEIRVLAPPPDAGWKDNNASCVVQIRGPGGGVLLTGDAEARAERWLVREVGAGLRADVVQVPHHGSLTSSTPAFVEAVDADYALVSNGYRNRFGFPRPEVERRWQDSGARLLETVSGGAIRIRILPESGVSRPRLHRREARRIWHWSR